MQDVLKVMNTRERPGRSAVIQKVLRAKGGAENFRRRRSLGGCRTLGTPQEAVEGSGRLRNRLKSRTLQEMRTGWMTGKTNGGPRNAVEGGGGMESREEF